ncbi:MAG: hypothetical protein JNJ45_04720 [Chthonomonas sp.]|nr:hypothetical protein [Chthonomonas sp.]
MSLTLIAALALQSAAAPAQEAVTLHRVLKKGDSLSYRVNGWLFSEQREQNLVTFLPSEEGVDYDFTLNIVEEKADGIARAIYRRPYMTIITGESSNSPEIRKKEKSDWNLELLLSPTNEVLDVKDITPKPTTKPPKKPAKPIFALTPSGKLNSAGQDIVGKYIGDIARLAMFVGDLDSGMDFNPKLPFSPIKPGKTWKKTVGYSPQRLKGSKNSAVQRLDYTFTYVGLASFNGVKVHRITATLDLNTDAGEFINQSLGMKPSESGLKKFQLALKANIEYDLDLKTCHTMAARATSEAGAKLEVTTSNDAVLELNMKGKTDLKLMSAKNGKA